ncbi:HdeD family acid-resistance protein [Candidatus Protofrankia datiscae]|nr:DUF308 domain-containing protein [Candidatus Protofrankia datiscae]
MMTTAETHRHHGGASSAVWMAGLFLGIAVTVLGVLLVAHPFAATRTLAILIGIGLVLSGIMDMVATARAGEETASFFGVLLVIGGIVVLAWPGVTLWTVALIVGICLLVAGVARIAMAGYARGHGRSWGWGVFIGLLAMGIGILALVWPAATVFILAVLFGIELIVHGIGQIALALTVRRESRA